MRSTFQEQRKPPSSNTMIPSARKTTFKKISLNPQQRQVSTNKSEGIYEFLYKMREMVKPSKDIQPGTCRKTKDECSVLECCFSEDTNNRGKVRGGGRNIIQKFNICLL